MSFTVQNFHVAQNTDLTDDSRYPLGDKPLVNPAALGINLAAFTAAAISLLNINQGTVTQVNYRSYLTGTSAATATLSVIATAGFLGNWSTDAAGNLNNPGTLAGSGSLQVIASDNAGNTASFPIQPWSILAPIQQGKVRWNPGHGGASAGILGSTDVISTKFKPEIDDMLKDSWIKTYRLFGQWGSQDIGPVTFTGSVSGTSGTLTANFTASGFFPSPGTYWFRFGSGDGRKCTVTGTSVTWTGALSAPTTTARVYYFDLLDQVIAYTSGTYGKPVIFCPLTMTFTGKKGIGQRPGAVPLYIQTNAGTYGAGPFADGTSGCWGPVDGSGVSSGVFAACLHRTAVNNEWIKYLQELGAYYNPNPFFDGVMIQENSATVGDCLALSSFGAPSTNDPTYSDAAFLIAQENFLTAAVAAFPNASVIMQNTWMQTPTPTQQLGVFMMNNRVAVSSADTQGASYLSLSGQLASWGALTMQGITVTGSTVTGLTDRRGSVACMFDVESGDIGGAVGKKISATPLDICNGLNQYIKASHAFWCHVPNNTPLWPAPNPLPTWAQITATLQANPLTNIAYPGNYP